MKLTFNNLLSKLNLKLIDDNFEELNLEDENKLSNAQFLTKLNLLSKPTQRNMRENVKIF